jgi:hypothetical protein
MGRWSSRLHRVPEYAFHHDHRSSSPSPSRAYVGDDGGDRLSDCPTFCVDFNNVEVYEAGAMVVALLVHPRDNKKEARAGLHASLCAGVLRANFGDDHTSRLMKPVYAFRDLKLIEKDLKILRRRLLDRMAAARMAIAYLKEASSGKPPKLPPGIKRLSLNQLSDMVLADTRESVPENVEVRVWGASLPVIHLASAIAVLADMADRAKDTKFSIAHLLVERSAIEWVVRAAEEYRSLLQRSSLKISPKKLVKIGLA